jgi:hypothetical protein
VQECLEWQPGTLAQGEDLVMRFASFLLLVGASIGGPWSLRVVESLDDTYDGECTMLTAAHQRSLPSVWVIATNPRTASTLLQRILRTIALILCDGKGVHNQYITRWPTEERKRNTVAVYKTHNISLLSTMQATFEEEPMKPWVFVTRKKEKDNVGDKARDAGLEVQFSQRCVCVCVCVCVCMYVYLCLPLAPSQLLLPIKPTSYI